MSANRNQPMTFNSLFVIMYILYNSDERARAIIMDQTKAYHPIPTHFRVFESIHEILPEFTKNTELPFVLSDGFTVVSLGLHKNKGK